MLILSKTSIKTSITILLFTIGTSYLFAGNQDPEINVPKQLEHTNINFHINSVITYYSFSHFVKIESKKLFIQAWLKDMEANKLSLQTDSLRKVYAKAFNDQKETISARILKNEAQTISLNEEIPTLYEKARIIENQYWQSATTDEIARFQEKIKACRDSIHLANQLREQKAILPHKEIPDTIIFYGSKPTLAEIKTEESVGIIYKIQIGSYKSKVPASAAKLIKKLSVLRKIENYKDEKGVTIYTTGSITRYVEAVTLHNQVKQEGMKNAIIEAYRNGKKITVADARKINKE